MYRSFSSQMSSGTLSCFHSDFSHRHTPILAAFITHMVPPSSGSPLGQSYSIPCGKLKCLWAAEFGLGKLNPVLFKETGS